MRLIDADALIKDIELSRNNNIHREARIKMNHETEHRHFLKIVAEQPTAFDKDKVIEKIKDESSLERFGDVGISGNVYGHYSKEVIDTEEAIEIVEKGGIK